MNNIDSIFENKCFSELDFMKDKIADFARTEWCSHSNHPLVSGFYEFRFAEKFNVSVCCDTPFMNWTGALWVNALGVAVPEKILEGAVWRGLNRQDYEKACAFAAVEPRPVKFMERRINSDRRNGVIRDGSENRGRRFDDLNFEDLPSGLPR